MKPEPPNNIDVGDMVRVDFNGSQYTLSKEAEVLSMPCATGDSWVFKDRLTKAIYYVSEGCTITKFHRNDN